MNYNDPEVRSRNKMKSLSKKQIRENLSSYLDTRKEVQFAYIFGSSAEGVSGPESDLDLAVYLDEDSNSNLDPLFETRLSLEIEEAVDDSFEVDVLVLNRASLVLKYQATNKGELVYYRDEGEARDYEALIRKKYFDFRPMRKEYNDQRLKRYGVS